MSAAKQTRREFIKRNSIAAAGALLASGLPPVAFASRGHEATVPAILGGKPVADVDWPKWPIWNSETDEKLLLEVVRSGVWSRKNVADDFDRKWAETLGAKRSLTVVNGTNAIIISLLKLEIGVGDEVIVPPYTFIATIQAVLATGAIPVFVDTNPETFQIDVEKIEEKITSRTKAILPVHLAGFPADMVRIMEIAKKHNLVVVEDACQAHLAEVNHLKVGTWGHAGCFSFQNSKHLPIGEGGAIVSNDESFMDRCHSYHYLGSPFGTVSSDGAEYVSNGNKLRFTEYQAAIGLAQLARLDMQTRSRTENGDYLKAKLQHVPGILPIIASPNVTRAVYHFFPFRYKKEEFKGLSRDGFIAALSAEGVPNYSGYTPLNTMPYLKDAFESKNFIKSYSKKRLDYQNYLSNNKCPENDKICNEEAVWLNQRFFLTGKAEMDLIFSAIEKIHTNAEKIKNAVNK